MMEMLEVAITKGSHPSAMESEAASQLRAETLEKVAQERGLCAAGPMVRVKTRSAQKSENLSDRCHPSYKSRGYCMILNLSHGVLRLVDVQHASVNEATDPNLLALLTESMAELGNVLPRLIYAVVATTPDAQGLIFFSKLDIKDGYWRMVTSEDDEWHFAYVLPKASPDEPTRNWISLPRSKWDGVKARHTFAQVQNCQGCCRTANHQAGRVTHLKAFHSAPSRRTGRRMISTPLKTSSPGCWRFTSTILSSSHR